MTTLAVLNTALLVVTLWLTFRGARDLDRGPRPSRLYLRFRGRALSGVCLGIAEYVGVPVWLVRTTALVLLWLGTHVVLAYVVLDLALAWHPDDRQFLLSNRIRAWLARRA